MTNTGKIKLGPWKEPEDVPPEQSCSLDIADNGSQTLETIGMIMDLTRERVRQIETLALHKIAMTVGDEEIRYWREKLFTP